MFIRILSQNLTPLLTHSLRRCAPSPSFPLLSLPRLASRSFASQAANPHRFGHALYDDDGNAVSPQIPQEIRGGRTLEWDDEEDYAVHPPAAHRASVAALQLSASMELLSPADLWALAAASMPLLDAYQLHLVFRRLVESSLSQNDPDLSLLHQDNLSFFLELCEALAEQVHVLHEQPVFNLFQACMHLHEGLTPEDRQRYLQEDGFKPHCNAFLLLFLRVAEKHLWNARVDQRAHQISHPERQTALNDLRHEIASQEGAAQLTQEQLQEKVAEKSLASGSLLHLLDYEQIVTATIPAEIRQRVVEAQRLSRPDLADPSNVQDELTLRPPFEEHAYLDAQLGDEEGSLPLQHPIPKHEIAKFLQAELIEDNEEDADGEEGEMKGDEGLENDGDDEDEDDVASKR